MTYWSCTVNSGDKIQTQVSLVPKGLNWAPPFQSSPFRWRVSWSPSLPCLLGKPPLPHLHGSNLVTSDSQQLCKHQGRMYLPGLLSPKIPAQRLEHYNKKIWGGYINKIHVHKCRQLGFSFWVWGQKCLGSLNKKGYEKFCSEVNSGSSSLLSFCWADTLQNEHVPKQKSDHGTITLWMGSRAQPSLPTPGRKMATLGCRWLRLTSW